MTSVLQEDLSEYRTKYVMLMDSIGVMEVEQNGIDPDFIFAISGFTIEKKRVIPELDDDLLEKIVEHYEEFGSEEDVRANWLKNYSYGPFYVYLISGSEEDIILSLQEILKSIKNPNNYQHKKFTAELSCTEIRCERVKRAIEFWFPEE